MRYAYDESLEKWVVLLDDIVMRMFDTEDAAKEFIGEE